MMMTGAIRILSASAMACQIYNPARVLVKKIKIPWSTYLFEEAKYSFPSVVPHRG